MPVFGELLKGVLHSDEAGNLERGRDVSLKVNMGQRPAERG